MSNVECQMVESLRAVIFILDYQCLKSVGNDVH